MRLTQVVVLAVVSGVAVGCGGGPRYVTVSGVVTYNGKPYANAFVSFQPVAGKDNLNPGKGSMGLTDAEGRFTLAVNPDTPGALVGLHAIRIYTQSGKGEAGPPPETGTPDDAAGAAKMEYDPIPLEWNERSNKTFVVPPAGTDAANFAITGPALHHRP